MYSGQFEMVTDFPSPPPPLEPPSEPHAASTAGAIAAPASNAPLRPRNRRRDIAARAIRTASARIIWSWSVMSSLRLSRRSLVPAPNPPRSLAPPEEPATALLPSDPDRVAGPQHREVRLRPDMGHEAAAVAGFEFEADERPLEHQILDHRREAVVAADLQVHALGPDHEGGRDRRRRGRPPPDRARWCRRPTDPRPIHSRLR